ncbi:hypothetical protein C3L33_20446, partial [Rhododendron williamsianum]
MAILTGVTQMHSLPVPQEKSSSSLRKTIHNDCAYVVDGVVYFSLDKYPNFGRLSGNSREDLLVTPDPKKRDPHDFALLRSPVNPIGTALGGFNLSTSQNEIATAGLHAKLASGLLGAYWQDNKVLPSFVFEALLDECALQISCELLTSQLDNASEAVFYIYQTLQDCEAAVSALRNGNPEEGAESNGKTTQISEEAKTCIYRLWNDFQTKMSDDLQTSPARIIKGQPKQHLPLIQSLIEIEKVVKEVLSILGLLSPLSYTEVVLQLKEKALDRANMKEDQVMDLIRKRAQARKERDFSSSDQIRRDLAAKGIALMDVGNLTYDYTTNYFNYDYTPTF